MRKSPVDLDLLAIVPLVLIAAHTPRRRDIHVVLAMAVDVSVAAVLGDGVVGQVNDVCIADVACSALGSGIEAACVFMSTKIEQGGRS